MKLVILLRKKGNYRELIEALDKVLNLVSHLKVIKILT